MMPSRLAHVVVGDQHADAAILEMAHQLADLVHRDRIDAGQRLVQQDEMRPRRQRPGDLHPPPLAARQRQRRRAAQMADAEFAEQVVQHRLRAFGIGLHHLEHRHTSARR